MGEESEVAVETPAETVAEVTAEAVAVEEAPGTGSPVFTKQLKDFACSPGQCCVLECRVSGEPDEVVWKREGTVIEDSFEFRTLHKGEVCTLVIGELFPEDAGIFACEAKNAAGSTKTSCKLSVQGEFTNFSSVSTKASAYYPPKPLPNSFSDKKDASLASSAMASLHENTPDEDNFKQEKNQLIADVARAIISPKPLQARRSETQLRPQLARIQRDIEHRQLLASVPAPKTAVYHSNVQLTAPLPPPPSSSPAAPLSPPTAQNGNGYSKSSTKPVHQQHQQKQQQQQQQQQIQRAVTPRPSVPQAQQGLQEYKVSSFEQRLINEIEYRLEQSPPVIEDAEDGTFEDVEVGEEKLPVFAVLLKNYQLKVGTAASLICQVSAVPRAKVFWFKDGKQISKRSRHYLTSCSDDGVCELRIPEIYAEDDGNYTALATNPLGRVSNTARIAVASHRIMNPDMVADGVVRSPKTADKGGLTEDEESAVEKYYRPVFVVKPPETVVAEEGKLVRFNVKCTGLPLPVISFSINGIAVRSDATHRILVRENNVHSLLFEQVSLMEQGLYEITAKNRAGTNVARVNLKVKARAFATPPTFVQRPTATCAAEGDAVRLEARVLATPRPVITWKKGSDQITHSHQTQIYQDDTGYVCLQISQAELSDTAWYTCSAVNKAGIASCNCKLDVYSPRPEVKAKHMRKIRTPNRYANLAKVAGVDMKEALAIDTRYDHLPESEDL